MSVYKWASPYEWLEEKAKEWDERKLYHELMNLASQLDSDTLQDEYQADMDADGYFDELEEG